VCVYILYRWHCRCRGQLGAAMSRQRGLGFFGFFFFALLTEAVPLTSYQRFPVRVLLMKKQRLRKFEKSVNGHMV
jgi:hypothetical protein